MKSTGLDGSVGSKLWGDKLGGRSENHNRPTLCYANEFKYMLQQDVAMQSFLMNT